MDRYKNRQMLLEALRSGDYIQGFKSLRKNTNSGILYCPLGVGCELFRQNYHGRYAYKWIDGYSDNERVIFCAIERGKKEPIRGSSSFMFEVVRDFYGLSYNDMMIIAEINDNQNKTFNEIATVIEKMEMTP